MHDPKLVEAIARALAKSCGAREPNWPEWIDNAEAALSAIAASGDWWIAPVSKGEALAYRSLPDFPNKKDGNTT